MTVHLFDAHNHLQDDWLAPHRQRVLADLAAANVAELVVNGTSEADWRQVAELCAPRPAGAPGPRLRASYGLHPWDVGNRGADWQRQLMERLDADPDAAVGEIGLDRWILDRAKPDDPRLNGLRRAPIEEQIEAFRWQLALAADRNLPASIHCLDAYGLLHDELRAARRPARGFLLHAYAGSADLAEAFVRLGAFFSFNGAFLEPRKAKLREVYARIPSDRLLVETDAPAMSLPANFARYTLPAAPGGDRVNHPANIVGAYAGLAAWRGTTVDELAATAEQNFHALFG